ncbi:hypothetical protein L0F63_006361, partial [Massospora cicadina]
DSPDEKEQSDQELGDEAIMAAHGIDQEDPMAPFLLEKAKKALRKEKKKKEKKLKKDKHKKSKNKHKSVEEKEEDAPATEREESRYVNYSPVRNSYSQRSISPFDRDSRSEHRLCPSPSSYRRSRR